MSEQIITKRELSDEELSNVFGGGSTDYIPIKPTLKCPLDELMPIEGLTYRACKVCYNIIMGGPLRLYSRKKLGSPRLLKLLLSGRG